jgi:plastocyanin
MISAGVLAACGGSDDTNGDGNAGAETQKAAVEIENFKFSPDNLEVAGGTTVQVTNADDVPHTLTADDGSFDTGNLAGGDSGSITVKGSGTVGYHCEIHDYMKATIEIS